MRDSLILWAAVSAAVGAFNCFSNTCNGQFPVAPARVDVRSENGYVWRFGQS